MTRAEFPGLDKTALACDGNKDLEAQATHPSAAWSTFPQTHQSSSPPSTLPGAGGKHCSPDARTPEVNAGARSVACPGTSLRARSGPWPLAPGLPPGPSAWRALGRLPAHAESGQRRALGVGGRAVSGAVAGPKRGGRPGAGAGAGGERGRPHLCGGAGRGGIHRRALPPQVTGPLETPLSMAT